MLIVVGNSKKNGILGLGEPPNSLVPAALRIYKHPSNHVRYPFSRSRLIANFCRMSAS